MIPAQKSKNTVYFRCDASKKTGAGHVMRCLTLADELTTRGWACLFVSEAETKNIVPSIQKYPLMEPGENLPGFADLYVIDHYGLDKDFESSVRQWARTILVIDDLADRLHDCDILLDQTMGRDPKDYEGLVPESCQIFCGSEYTLLRPQFSEKTVAAQAKRKQTTKIENILISFGATNPHNLTEKILTVLSSFSEWPLEIDVVMSDAAEGKDKVLKLCQKITKETPHNVTLLTDVQDMAACMLKADMAFGGGGTTSWERACLGLPTILIEVADNQRYVSENLHKAGAVVKIGDYRTVDLPEIDKAFENMRNDNHLLRKMSQKAFRVCDGKGASRLCKIIQETSR
jgi:UDP-2,4-diacetamido-2,4,6-trideoxy-beta-L-altropyranose hydrolase